MVQLLIINVHQQTEISDTGSYTGQMGLISFDLITCIFFPGYSFSLSQWRHFQKTIHPTCLKLLSLDDRTLCLKMYWLRSNPSPVIHKLGKANFTIRDSTNCCCSSALWHLFTRNSCNSLKISTRFSIGPLALINSI